MAAESAPTFRPRAVLHGCVRVFTGLGCRLAATPPRDGTPRLAPLFRRGFRRRRARRARPRSPDDEAASPTGTGWAVAGSRRTRRADPGGTRSRREIRRRQARRAVLHSLGPRTRQSGATFAKARRPIAAGRWVHAGTENQGTRRLPAAAFANGDRDPPSRVSPHRQSPPTAAPPRPRAARLGIEWRSPRHATRSRRETRRRRARRARPDSPDRTAALFDAAGCAAGASKSVRHASPSRRGFAGAASATRSWRSLVAGRPAAGRPRGRAGGGARGTAPWGTRRVPAAAFAFGERDAPSRAFAADEGGGQAREGRRRPHPFSTRATIVVVRSYALTIDHRHRLGVRRRARRAFQRSHDRVARIDAGDHPRRPPRRRGRGCAPERRLGY